MYELFMLVCWISGDPVGDKWFARDTFTYQEATNEAYDWFTFKPNECEVYELDIPSDTPLATGLWFYPELP